MPGPYRDDTQQPKRIALPTLNGKMGQYDKGKPPFMNTQNAGISTPGGTGSQVNWNPLTQRGPFGGGSTPVPNSMPVNYNAGLFPGGAGGGPSAPGVPGGTGWLGRVASGMFSPNNPFASSMGGAVGAMLRMKQGLPFASGGGMGGAPALTAVEQYARNTINKALGEGWYENFVKTRGMSPVDFYRDPRNKYWDEPDSPDGAINSAIRDEINNARNAAQWAQEHGNVAIPQETWDRWYYANRQGMKPADVMNDGSEVVY